MGKTDGGDTVKKTFHYNLKFQMLNVKLWKTHLYFLIYNFAFSIIFSLLVPAIVSALQRDVASQTICAQLTSKTDGSIVTAGTTSVYITGDNIQGSGVGVIAHAGSGLWCYAPTQSETDYAHVAYTFTNTDAITTSVQTYPGEGIDVVKEELVASILGNLSTGVFQNLITTTDNTPINVTRGDYLPAGTITFNFGSQWALSGQKIYFTVKKNKTDTARLVDVLCTLTDGANVIGTVGAIDLDALGLAAGDYYFEYRRYKSDDTEPRVIRQGKFHVNQDIRQ